MLPPCEQVRARVQRPPCPIQRIRSSSTMTSCLLLDTATNVIEGITGKFDDVEWVHDFDSIGQFLCGRGLEPGESVHRNNLNAITPSTFRSCGQPLLEDLLRPTGHHIEKACRSRSLADRGEIDDDGDVFVPASGVSPHVLIDADHRHTVESIRIVDQQPVSFGQDRGIRGMPGHRDLVSDHGHGVVINNECTQCPIESGSRDLGPGWCRSRGVLAPHVAAFDALVATQTNMQCRGPVPEGFVGQSTQNSVADFAVAATPAAPIIGRIRSAFQHRFVGGDVLADAGQVKSVEAGECREVRG